MGGKVLVTRDFHRKALQAIEFQDRHQEDELADILRQSWMSFIEHKADEKLIEEFTNYCEEYAVQLGLGEMLTRTGNE